MVTNAWEDKQPSSESCSDDNTHSHHSHSDEGHHHGHYKRHHRHGNHAVVADNWSSWGAQ